MVPVPGHGRGTLASQKRSRGTGRDREERYGEDYGTTLFLDHAATLCGLAVYGSCSDAVTGCTCCIVHSQNDHCASLHVAYASAPSASRMHQRDHARYTVTACSDRRHCADDCMADFSSWYGEPWLNAGDLGTKDDTIWEEIAPNAPPELLRQSSSDTIQLIRLSVPADARCLRRVRLNPPFGP